MAQRPINFDTSKTLQELENCDWGEPNFGSYLVTTCYRLRRVPLCDFTAEDLRIMIGQQISPEYLIPVALNRLDKKPFLEGHFYEGALLEVVIRIDREFWQQMPDLYEQAVEIVLKALHTEYKKSEEGYMEFFEKLESFVNSSGFATYQTPIRDPSIRSLEELFEAADEGKLLSDKELDHVVQLLQHSPDDWEVAKLIDILGYCGYSQYRKLVESFVRNPNFYYGCSRALEALCRCWELTRDYLDDLKFYLRGEAEWDVEGHIRECCITFVGEFLSENYDKELLQMLLDLFRDDEDTTMQFKPDKHGLLRSCAHKELIKGDKSTLIVYHGLRTAAYKALALAVGEGGKVFPEDKVAWKMKIYRNGKVFKEHKIYQGITIYNSIEEGNLAALDPLIIQKAEKMIQEKE